MLAAIVASSFLRCHRCTSLSHTHSCLILSCHSYKTWSWFGDYFTNEFRWHPTFRAFIKSVHSRSLYFLSFRSLYLSLSIFKSHHCFVNFFFSFRGLKCRLKKKSTVVQFVTHYVRCNHSRFLFAWYTRRILNILMIVSLSVGFRGDSRKLLAVSQK